MSQTDIVSNNGPDYFQKKIIVSRNDSTRTSLNSIKSKEVNTSKTSKSYESITSGTKKNNNILNNIKNVIIGAYKKFTCLFNKLLKGSNTINNPGIYQTHSKVNSNLNSNQLTLNNPIILKQKNEQLKQSQLNTEPPKKFTAYHPRTDIENLGNIANIKKIKNCKVYSRDDKANSLEDQVLKECEKEVSDLESDVNNFIENIAKLPFNFDNDSDLSNNHKKFIKLDQLNMKIDSIENKLKRIITNDKAWKELIQHISSLKTKINKVYREKLNECDKNNDPIVSIQKKIYTTYLTIIQQCTELQDNYYDKVQGGLSDYVRGRIKLNNNTMCFDGKEGVINLKTNHPEKKVNQDIRNQMYKPLVTLASLESYIRSTLNDCKNKVSNQNKNNAINAIIAINAINQIITCIGKRTDETYYEVQKQQLCSAYLHHDNKITIDFIEIPKLIAEYINAVLDSSYCMSELDPTILSNLSSRENLLQSTNSSVVSQNNLKNYEKKIT